MLMTKATRLLSLLPSRPQEFYDRIATILQDRFERLTTRVPHYQTIQWADLVLGLEKCLRANLNGLTRETALERIEGHVRSETERLRPCAPFRLSHNADFTLARICYLVCRALKPAIVLETGVGYGVTSAFVLEALEQNQHGMLHSVDLPPLGPDADRFVGCLIPERTRSRWQLHPGPSKRIVPLLLNELSGIDVFIHDSLHTYRNISRELQMVSPHLASRSVVIADDVQGNHAFYEWTMRSRPAFWATMKEKEKDSLFGVSVLVGENRLRSAQRVE